MDIGGRNSDLPSDFLYRRLPEAILGYGIDGRIDELLATVNLKSFWHYPVS
jgi:hypothetical protein